MKIYVDVLFLSSFITSLFTLMLLSKLIHIRIRRKRFLTASAVSALSSLLIFIKPGGFAASLLITVIKLAVSAVTLLCAVGKVNLKTFISRWIVFLTVNILMSGICMLIWDIFGGDVIIIRNCTVYLNVPLHLMIVCIAVSYAVISLYDKAVSIKASREMSYKVIYSYGDRSIIMPAVCDSGNLLTDSFSGEPVVILLSRRLYEYFGIDNEKSCLANSFHLIPYKTVDGSRLMPVTLKGEIVIKGGNGSTKDVKCAVGILDSKETDKAIFNPKLLI